MSIAVLSKSFTCADHHEYVLGVFVDATRQLYPGPYILSSLNTSEVYDVITKSIQKSIFEFQDLPHGAKVYFIDKSFLFLREDETEQLQYTCGARD